VSSHSSPTALSGQGVLGEEVHLGRPRADWLITAGYLTEKVIFE
jgi:hypothetical protein